MKLHGVAVKIHKMMQLQMQHKIRGASFVARPPTSTGMER